MASLTLRNRIVLFAIWCATVAVVAQAQSASSAGKAGSRHSALQTMLERREKQGWEAFKHKDRNGFSAIATDDYTAVIADGNGERDLKGTLDSMKEITINSYTLSDFKLTSMGANAALLRYKASASYTIGTQPISGKLAVTDIWGEAWQSMEVSALPRNGNEVATHACGQVATNRDGTHNPRNPLVTGRLVGKPEVIVRSGFRDNFRIARQPPTIPNSRE